MLHMQNIRGFPFSIPPREKRCKMTKTQQDFAKVMQDMLSAFPVDAGAVKNVFRTQALLGEKMSRIALDAAEKSTEVSSRWTKDTIARLSDVSTVKDEPAEYGKSLTEFASASTESAAEKLAAFAEIAKKVQMETVELILAAGKEFGEDATAAVKKATNGVAKAAKTTAG